MNVRDGATQLEVNNGIKPQQTQLKPGDYMTSTIFRFLLGNNSQQFASILCVSQKFLTSNAEQERF